MKDTRYFKCSYPPNLATLQAANFARPCYSPGWYGSCGHATRGKIDLMNDALGWCLVQFENDTPSLPDDGTIFTQLSEADYNTLLTQYQVQVTDGSNGLWAGETLAHRWDNKPTAFCKDFIIDFNGKTWPKTLKYSDDSGCMDYKPPAIPKYLVKNLKKEYLEKFRATGEVRVSSIARFRTMGGYGQDEKEGIKKTNICIDFGEPKEFKANELGRFISYFKMDGPDSIEINGKIIIKDNTFLPDVYVFCASFKTIDTRVGQTIELSICRDLVRISLNPFAK